jgi:hypothetical protein
MSIKDTAEERTARLALERRTRTIADKIAADLPPGTGFAFFAFDFGERGNFAYVSSADRGDIVRALKEWIRKVGGEDGVS